MFGTPIGTGIMVPFAGLFSGGSVMDGLCAASFRSLDGLG